MSMHDKISRAKISNFVSVLIFEPDCINNMCIARRRSIERRMRVAASVVQTV